MKLMKYNSIAILERKFLSFLINFSEQHKSLIPCVTVHISKCSTMTSYFYKVITKCSSCKIYN